MFKRVVSALVLLALSAFCFIMCKETAVIYVIVCACICFYEMTNCLKKLDKKPLMIIPCIFAVACAAVMYFEKLHILWLAAVLLLIFLATFVFCMKSENHRAQDALATFEMLLYPGLAIMGILYVCCLPRKEYAVIFTTGFLSAVSCDTFALFGGMAFGRHKLAPTVSPKKTIEGSVSGTLVTVGIGVGAWFLFKDYMLVSLVKYIIIVFVCTIVSQIGDLSASFIKREAGIKDYGNLIPGHGGMMDRIDSLMMSIPAAYILTELLR